MLAAWKTSGHRPSRLYHLHCPTAYRLVPLPFVVILAGTPIWTLCPRPTLVKGTICIRNHGYVTTPARGFSVNLRQWRTRLRFAFALQWCRSAPVRHRTVVLRLPGAPRKYELAPSEPRALNEICTHSIMTDNQSSQWHMQSVTRGGLPSFSRPLPTMTSNLSVQSSQHRIPLCFP